MKDHPRSSGSGTRSPWATGDGRLGTPTGGNSAPYGRLPQTHCPASAGEHLWRNRGLLVLLAQHSFLSAVLSTLTKTDFTKARTQTWFLLFALDSSLRMNLFVVSFLPYERILSFNLRRDKPGSRAQCANISFQNSNSSNKRCARVCYLSPLLVCVLC